MFKEIEVYLRVRIGFHNRIAQTEWLKQRKLASHSFGGYRSKMQVPSAVVLVRPLFLTCRWPPSHAFRVTFSLHMHRELWYLILLNKDTIPVRLGPHFMTSFDYLPKDSVSRYSHVVD